MTGDELIEKIQALTPEQRSLTVYFNWFADDYGYGFSGGPMKQGKVATVEVCREYISLSD